MTPTIRRRLFVGGCLVIAVVCVVLAVQPDPSASGSTHDAGATPVWSARRAPTPVVTFVAGQRLTDRLVGVLGDNDACLVVSDGGGRITEVAADRPFTPASTMKVITAIGALERLGPDFTFVTEVLAPPGTAESATTPTQLWLVGGGDALLGTDEWRAARDADPMRAGTPTTPLEALADAVVAAGVRAVPGGIVGDSSASNGEPEFLESWDESYRTRAIGPLGALTVNGGFRPDGSRVDDAALYAAQELTALLSARGVAVGPASVGSASPNAVAVASVASPPLEAVVGEMLATSDNLVAESLLRAIALQGAQNGGGRSSEDGARLVAESLVGLGVPTDGLVQIDGSGLSTANKLTCETLDAALALAQSDDRFVAVRDGMAIAGERGTLAPRLVGTPLDGNLYAKTGTLPGVSGLGGWIVVGPEIRFAFVANGAFSQDAASGVREDVALVLAGHPDAPAAEVLVPMP